MEIRSWQWLGVDHITYAVWDIAKWRAVYVDDFDFREIHYTPDALPNGSSSMQLCGLESGDTRIALVSPISRSSVSHVEHFLRAHGDHSIQHVAYAIHNLEVFVARMSAKGFKFLGEIKTRSDSFGPVKQIFAKRFDPAMSVAEGAFFEFVERPEHIPGSSHEFFSSKVAEELYADVERESKMDDGKPFIDISHSKGEQDDSSGN